MPNVFVRVYQSARNAFSRRKTEMASWASEWLKGNAVPGTTLYGWNRTDLAMRASAVSASVRLIAGVAKLPIHAYRRVGENRERTRGHWVERLLARPNSWMTGYEFRRMMTAHAALSGNAYALKRFEGARVVELIPLEPSRVKVEQAEFDQAPTYEYRRATGQTRRYAASEILHLRDLTLDGKEGVSRIDQARQAIELTLSAENFATAFFRNGSEPGISLSYAGNLSDEEYKRLNAFFQTRTGSQNAYMPLVLEGGAKVDRVGSTNQESQMLELRTFQVEDIARLYGVPPHLIGLSEKQTSWGTGVEQMALGFLKFHLLDWLVMWETAIQRDLLTDEMDRDVFVEHVVDGLLRADFKTRMEGYQLAVQNGILSPDEVRQLENRSPRADGKGDEYWRPSNMTGGELEPPEEMPLAAGMPGSRPRHAWRAKQKTTQRELLERLSRHAFEQSRDEV